MNSEKMLSIAMTLRETAAELVAQAERLEIKARIERAKAVPEVGDLLAKLIEFHELKNSVKNRGLN